MIPAFASRIVVLLQKNQVIQKGEMEIYQYGLEMIVSTIVNLLLLLLIGVLFHELFSAVLFFCLFVLIRQKSGGYHADTYFKCNSIFAVNLTLVLLWTKFASEFYSVSSHVIFLAIYFFIVAKYAPRENPNKPLLFAQKKKCKWCCLLYGIILTVTSFILWYGCHLKKYAVLIAVTMLSVAIAMTDVFFEKGGECYEEDCSEGSCCCRQENGYKGLR